MYSNDQIIGINVISIHVLLKYSETLFCWAGKPNLHLPYFNKFASIIIIIYNNYNFINIKRYKYEINYPNTLL